MKETERKILNKNKIETSCPFPLIGYETHVVYNKVGKASGMAYILLELIANYELFDGYLADVLKEFGIPSDLHPIFAEELVKLMKSDIVGSDWSDEDVSDNFGNLRTDDFSLTQKGVRMFRDGVIPVDGEKTRTKTLYYSPVTRKYRIESDQKVNMVEYASNSLSGDGMLMEKVGREAGMDGIEDFVRGNKTGFGIRKDEEIVRVTPEEPAWKAVRDDMMTISVYSDGVGFSFATSDERAFVNKYYSSSTMENILSKKQNYRFADGMETSEGDLVGIGPDTVYIPGDLSKLVEARCSVYIGKRDAGTRSGGDSITVGDAYSEELLSVLGDGTLFCLLEGVSCRYFRAYDMRMPCPQLGGDFTMPLLAEFRAADDVREKLCSRLVDIYGKEPFSKDGAGIIAYVAGQCATPESVFRDYAAKKLGDVSSSEEKMRMLIDIDRVVSGKPGWKPVLDEFGRELYDEFMEEPGSGDVRYKSTVAEPLRKKLGIDDREFMKDLARSLENGMGAESAFAALEKAGFETELILTAVNVIPVYSKMVLDNTEITAMGLGISFNNVRASMWALNDMLGIKSYTGVMPDDVPESDEFIKTAASFDDAWKKIKEYEPYAKKEYGEIEAYSDIYRPVRDTLETEKAARENPEAITREYIDGLLKKGNLKEAVCDLVVRMCYDLSERLKVDGHTTSTDLIGGAVKAGYISRAQADRLHKLRICRNGFQHPVEDKRAKATPELVRECEDIIFSTEAKEK